MSFKTVAVALGFHPFQYHMTAQNPVISIPQQTSLFTSEDIVIFRNAREGTCATCNKVSKRRITLNACEMHRKFPKEKKKYQASYFDYICSASLDHRPIFRGGLDCTRTSNACISARKSQGWSKKSRLCVQKECGTQFMWGAANSTPK